MSVKNNFIPPPTQTTKARNLQLGTLCTNPLGKLFLRGHGGMVELSGYCKIYLTDYCHQDYTPLPKGTTITLMQE